MPRLPGRERSDGGEERLVEAVGDGVYALDGDGRFVDVNDTIVELSGYEKSEILAAGPWLWHDDADLYRFEKAIQSLLSEDEDSMERVEATMETADGERLPVEVTITLLWREGDEYRGHAGVVRDISHRTDRPHRQHDLAEYETILSAMPDEVYTLDADGRFTSIIPVAGAERLTSGYTPAELRGKHVSAVMDETDVERGREMIETLLASEDRERASFEMEIVTRDGQRVPHENHIALLSSPDGEFRGTVGVLRDISERKARERALERQNERLEEFANVVSHDLRNPLNVASATLELLQDDYEDDRLDRIADAHDRMSTIIEDVLALSREGAEVEETEPVSLRRIGRYAWSSIESGEASIGVTGDLVLRAEPGSFGRLLENLFRNAIDHGGEDVTVTLGPLPVDRGELGFFVEDDGPGIPDADRDAVFESGYSDAGGGTGLGLAIVQRIAQAHGWDVTVTEGTAGGARFEFTDIMPG